MMGSCLILNHWSFQLWTFCLADTSSPGFSARCIFHPEIIPEIEPGTIHTRHVPCHWAMDYALSWLQSCAHEAWWCACCGHCQGSWACWGEGNQHGAGLLCLPLPLNHSKMELFGKQGAWLGCTWHRWWWHEQCNMNVHQAPWKPILHQVPLLLRLALNKHST